MALHTMVILSIYLIGLLTQLIVGVVLIIWGQGRDPAYSLFGLAFALGALKSLIELLLAFDNQSK